MTLTAIVVRHGKSEPECPGVIDHDRPLAPRGRRNARAIGAWMNRNVAPPNAILCSSARRAGETLALIGTEAPLPPYKPAPELYHATAESVFDAMQRQTGECLLVVGHNPGLFELVAGLADASCSRVGVDRFPTCATAVITFDATRWNTINKRLGRVEKFVVPREL